MLPYKQHLVQVLAIPVLSTNQQHAVATDRIIKRAQKEAINTETETPQSTRTKQTKHQTAKVEVNCMKLVQPKAHNLPWKLC